MNLQEALELLSQGKKVKLPEWTGYWFTSDTPDNYKLPINQRIYVFTKNGEVLDTPWVDKYKDRTDFYEASGDMGFDFAILALKNGKCVARKGWNGKGMWIALTEGSIIDKVFARSGATLKYAQSLPDGGTVTIGSHIDMKSAQNTIEVGWKPTSMDMLADDWELVHP